MRDSLIINENRRIGQYYISYRNQTTAKPILMEVDAAVAADFCLATDKAAYPGLCRSWLGLQMQEEFIS